MAPSWQTFFFPMRTGELDGFRQGAMSDYHINVFWSEEDGGYIADIPDLNSCSAFGRTAEEAAGEVTKAREAWLEAAREAGKPIPEPRYRLAPLSR
jgi:predicted RNase H-like HicB family nuclease